MPSSTVSQKTLRPVFIGLSRIDSSFANYFTVKFDTAKLPPILNALSTENNGQKLTLEVAVCIDLNNSELTPN